MRSLELTQLNCQPYLQVCWERIHGHLLATSHFDSVKLWDRRYASSPVQYINAHPGQVIHALDFSTNRQSRFV